jgi:hypothetical protein
MESFSSALISGGESIPSEFATSTPEQIALYGSPGRSAVPPLPGPPFLGRGVDPPHSAEAAGRILIETREKWKSRDKGFVGAFGPSARNRLFVLVGLGAGFCVAAAITLYVASTVPFEATKVAVLAAVGSNFENRFTPALYAHFITSAQPSFLPAIPCRRLVGTPIATYPQAGLG